MSTLIKKIFFSLIVINAIASCVPAKRYYEMDSSYKKMQATMRSDSSEIKRLRDANGDQLMKLLSLSEDSIRLHYAFDSLMNKHQEVSYIGSVELANAKRELDNKDLEVTQIEQNSKKIMYSFRSYDVEINTLSRQLERFVLRYRSAGAKVENHLWSTVLTLPTGLIYEDNSYEKLSQQGVSIVTAIGNLAKQYPKFSIATVEYSEPTVKTITTEKIQTFEVLDSVKYTYQVDSVTNKTIYLPYSYEGFKKSVEDIDIPVPMNIKKSSAIIQYIKCNYPDVVILGNVISTKQIGYNESSIQVIIAPRIKSLLTDIGKL